MSSAFKLEDEVRLLDRELAMLAPGQYASFAQTFAEDKKMDADMTQLVIAHAKSKMSWGGASVGDVSGVHSMH